MTEYFTSLATQLPLKVFEADSSSSKSPVSDNDIASHTNHALNKGEGCMLDVTRLKSDPFSLQSAEQQPLQPSI
ncbi:uncharacterized protein BDW43DRAFT_263869 [Aspergillus alliaceus]|uniref:uncharacterized protein n=1 Tax=Petromyces alliaceus TaxID=209559 RepID=UPI0012A6A16E|nr:uncharacterized protein BDW43DRAFT_263869 [Aspergillus alliaceus]KAB8237651.1 hypothetical protein BDW43DRAFT_263869 [Aspergillus alliaceus]